MITKIELKELFYNIEETRLIIDLENKNVIYLKNDVIIKNEHQYLDIKKITTLIKENITYWDNKYIDDSIIDGVKTELNIHTSNEIIKYNFKNKFPSNYSSFIKCFKEMVNVL